MNDLDFVILVVLGVGAIYGLSRGALGMVTSIVSLVAAIYFASIYYRWVGALAERELAVNPTVASALGYAVSFAVVFVTVEYGGHVIARLIHIVHLGWLDRLSGGAIGAAIAGALLGLVVMLMTAILPSEAALIRESQLAPHLLTYTETLLAYIPPDVKDAYARHRAELTRYWLDQAARSAASPSATPTK